MSELFSFLLVFIVALALGLFIGKLLFSARFESQKISLEEKINAAQHLLQQQKEQATIDKTAFEKQLQNSLQEKEAIRTVTFTFGTHMVLLILMSASKTPL